MPHIIVLLVCQASSSTFRHADLQKSTVPFREQDLDLEVIGLLTNAAVQGLYGVRAQCDRALR